MAGDDGWQTADRDHVSAIVLIAVYNTFLNNYKNKNMLHTLFRWVFNYCIFRNSCLNGASSYEVMVAFISEDKKKRQNWIKKEKKTIKSWANESLTFSLIFIHKNWNQTKSY